LTHIKSHLKDTDETSYTVQDVQGAFWFELEDEYIEEAELPIQVDATFLSPEGKKAKGPVYIFIDFTTGELTDEVELEVDELEDA
jgi:hypothetical protein